MNYNEVLIEMPDGRNLEVATLGEPSGHTVLFHHGTPGSTNLVKMFAPLADDGSLFVITTARAGYGKSSRLEGRDVAAVVGDAREALDSLSRSDYVAVGWSGGGPDALACEDFAASLRQGFEFGWRGFFDDDQAMMKEWGFDPATITVPVSVWFGDQDLMVPRTHGEWLAKNLPTASKHFFAGDGHVSLVLNHLDELHAAINATYA